MIAISRETDYACRVILYLAELPPNQRATAQEIARQRKIPTTLIRRIVTRLGAGKLITTVRGKGGGLTLAQPPNQISLLNVVETIEGAVAINRCLLALPKCTLASECPQHCGWRQVQTKLKAELEQITFDKLIENNRVPNAGYTDHGH